AAPAPVKPAPVATAPVQPAPAPPPAPVKPAPAAPAPVKPAPTPAPAAKKPVPTGLAGPLRPFPPAPSPPPKMKLVVLSGAPVGQATLLRPQSDRVISVHQDEITACFRQELQQHPAPSGRVIIIFSVDATGATTEARIDTATLHSGALEACILQRVRAWRFPA